MPHRRDRIKNERRPSPSLTWVMAGDRSGVFGRSLALACIGAVLWVLALDWTISRLGGKRTVLFALQRS